MLAAERASLENPLEVSPCAAPHEDFLEVHQEQEAVAPSSCYSVEASSVQTSDC